MPNRVALSQWVCLVGFVFLSLAAKVQAQGPKPQDPKAEPKVVSQHTRVFRVIVDRKPRGTHMMTIQRRQDASEVMRGESNVFINFIAYKFYYTSNGSETWKSGRLIQLVNESDYNGEKFVVQGAATQQALNYEVNGESQKAPADAFASYWREPPAKRVGQKVNILNADKGLQMTADLERLENDTIKIDTESMKAKHYRLRGEVDVDVWYDELGYLVRQESLETGHRTILELIEIKLPGQGQTAERPEKTEKQ
jgi:hypothetical protein